MYTCRFISLYWHKENRRSLKKVFLEKRTSSTRSYFPRSWYISRTIRSLVQNTWIGFQTQEPHMTSRLYNWKYRSIHVLGYQIHEKLCTFHGNRSWILLSPIYYWFFSPQNVFVYAHLFAFGVVVFLTSLLPLLYLLSAYQRQAFIRSSVALTHTITVHYIVW